MSGRAAAPASGQEEAAEPRIGKKDDFSVQFKPRTSVRPRGDAALSDEGSAFPV